MNEKRKRKLQIFPSSIAQRLFISLWWFGFLCVARSASVLSVVQICFCKICTKRSEREEKEKTTDFSFLYSAASLYLFVRIWFSLCSAQRLCVLSGSNMFLHKDKWTRRQRENRRFFFLYSVAPLILFVNHRIIARCKIAPYRLPFKAYRLVLAAML
mgnify:CR=1 FL=1